MAIKVGMVSLGCPKNQMDAELMLAKLEQAGFEITAESGLAEVVIINTCGFIEDAKQESIDNILEFAQRKKEKQIKKIIVTAGNNIAALAHVLHHFAFCAENALS